MERAVATSITLITPPTPAVSIPSSGSPCLHLGGCLPSSISCILSIIPRSHRAELAGGDPQQQGKAAPPAAGGGQAIQAVSATAPCQPQLTAPAVAAAAIAATSLKPAFSAPSRPSLGGHTHSHTPFPINMQHTLLGLNTLWQHKEKDTPLHKQPITIHPGNTLLCKATPPTPKIVEPHPSNLALQSRLRLPSIALALPQCITPPPPGWVMLRRSHQCQSSQGVESAK